VDRVEIQAFFGLLILAGLERHRRYPIKKMYAKNQLATSSVSCTTWAEPISVNVLPSV